jgi:hypothetical protein
MLSNAPFRADPAGNFAVTKAGSDRRAHVMKQQPKRAGHRRILVAAIAIPVLYVLSSGPALSFAFTWHQPTVHDDGDGDLGVTINLDEGPWWPVVYAPLQWASEQAWGEWLCWYWELFPISSDQSGLKG